MEGKRSFEESQGDVDELSASNDPVDVGEDEDTDDTPRYVCVEIPGTVKNPEYSQPQERSPWIALTVF